MNWQDYTLKQRYKEIAIGELDGNYVLEHKIQSGMASDFYKLRKDEYDTFLEWCKDEVKIAEIEQRKVWVRGFFRTSEFRIM